MADKSLSAALKNSPAVLGTMGTAKDLVAQMLPAIQQALPKHISADRVSRIILTEFHKNPKLLTCSRASIIGGILQSSQLGLEIGSGLGHAYLIPFDKRSKDSTGNWSVVSTEAQLVIGYQGMLELANRSGNLISIHASAVRKGDIFTHKRSLEGDTLEHEERWESDDITHFYCLARFKNGGHAFLVWPAAKMRAHAIKNSKVRGKLVGPWEDDYEAMGCKTMVRALFKFLPKSAEIADAVRIDGAVVKHDVDTGDLLAEVDTPLSIEAEVVDEPATDAAPTEQ